jgi:hypothetical protein
MNGAFCQVDPIFDRISDRFLHVSYLGSKLSRHRADFGKPRTLLRKIQGGTRGVVYIAARQDFRIEVNPEKSCKSCLFREE